MNLRQSLVVAGVGLFGLGLLELLRPNLVLLPASDALLVGLGVVALLYGLLAFAERRREGPGRAETPDVEIATPPELAGTDIGTALEGVPGVEGVRRGVVPSLRGELRKAATVFLTRYRGLDSETAWEQVTDGTWTDDPRAAGFLAGGEPPLRRRLYSLVRSGRRTARDRAAAAVAAVAGVEPDRADLTLEDDIEHTGTLAATASESRYQTDHWTGVSVVVLVCLGAGVILEKPGVLLAGVVAVGYAAYARLTPPQTVALSTTRSVSDTDPDPGDEVTVTVTVTNEGGFCPDLRVVDGVPASLTVADGTPRRAVWLRAGESVTLTYTVTARPGTHEFGPTQVIARNLSNSAEQSLLLSAPATLTSVHRSGPVEGPVPLRDQPTQHAGRVSADSGGEGVEFHTVREYRPGDSMTRIDWNRRARTGELRTVEFRPERATRVVLLVDTRPGAHVGHSHRGPSAVERSVEATQRVFPALLGDGHQVGLGTLGPDDCFLAPDAGAGHRKRGRELLATDPAFDTGTDAGSDECSWLSRLRRRLSGDTQLLVFSPLLDARTVGVVRRLTAHGHPTSVVSPDETIGATPGRQLLSARRRLLVAELRQTGVPVLDWAPGESLETLFERERVTR